MLKVGQKLRCRVEALFGSSGVFPNHECYKKERTQIKRNCQGAIFEIQEITKSGNFDHQYRYFLYSADLKWSAAVGEDTWFKYFAIAVSPGQIWRSFK